MGKDIRITPASAKIGFSGSAANTIDLLVESDGSVNFSGASGSLLGITDNFSGSLMSVSDISGIPILEVFDDDRVVMGKHSSPAATVTGSKIGIGTASPTHKLHAYSVDNKGFFLEKNLGNNADNLNEFSAYYSLSIKNRNAGSYLNFGGDANRTDIQATDGAGSATAKILALNPFGGNVGIGTATPVGKLHVLGSFYNHLELESASGNVAITFDVETSNTNYYDWRIDAQGTVANALCFGHSTAAGNQTFNAANMVMTMLSSGYVGIGTTSPVAKLHVYTGDSGFDATTNGDELFIESSGHAGMTIGSGTTSQGNIFFGDSGDPAVGIIRYDHNTNLLQMGAGGSSTHLIINASGHVGIGTVTPTGQASCGALHIYGNHNSNNTILKIEQDGASSSALIQIDSAAGRDSEIQFQENGTNMAAIRNDASADSLILTDGAYSDTLHLKGGKVGIGIAAPATALLTIYGQNNSAGDMWTVVGAGNAPHMIVQNGGTSDNTNAGYFFKDNDGYVGGMGMRFTDHSPNNSQIRFSTADSNNTREKVVITENGSVGIGTMNPTGSLHVYAAQPEVIIQNSTQDGSSTMLRLTEAPVDGKAGGYLHYDGSANKFHIGTHISGTDTAKITILRDSTAVGIGVTSPSAILDTQGSSDGPSLNMRTTDAFAVSSAQSGAEMVIGGTTNSPHTVWMQNRHKSANGYAYPIAINPSGGNVGIGTTNPDTTLDIHGALTVDGNGGQAQLKMRADDGDSQAIYFTNAASGYEGAITYTNTGTTAEKMDFYVNQGTRMTILGSGNVGIGTTTPDTKLHVYTLGAGLKVNAAGESPFTQKIAEFNYVGNGNSLFIENIGGKAALNSNSGNLHLGTQGYSRINIDSAGHVMMPYTVAFLARNSQTDSNISNSSSSPTTMDFNTESFDQNSDYNNSTNVFTAPVAGKYMLGFSLRLQSIDTAATYYNFRIVTSNRNYTCFFEPDKWSSDTSLYNTINYSALVDMDANDTAEINGFSSGGTSQTDVIGNSSTAHSIFWGYLVA